MKFIDLNEGDKFSLVQGKPDILVKLFEWPHNLKDGPGGVNGNPAYRNFSITDENTVNIRDKHFLWIDPATTVFQSSRSVAKEFYQEVEKATNDQLLKDHFEKAKDWICECGMRGCPLDSSWRFNGKDWEHSHGYPIGHVTAKLQPKQDMTKALQDFIHNGLEPDICNAVCYDSYYGCGLPIGHAGSHVAMDKIIPPDPPETQRKDYRWNSDWGWTIRVVGSGSDKSDYHVVRVYESPGFEDDIVTYYHSKTDVGPKQKDGQVHLLGRTFKRQHPIFHLRQEARDLKKKLCKEKKVTNVNRWPHDNPDW